MTGHVVLNMNYDKLVNEAITLTRQMLELAKSGDWDQVIQSDGRRRRLFDLMAKTDLATINSGVGKNLEILISLNDELTTLSVLEKEACFTNFSANKKKKKAFNAYIAC